MSEKSSGKWLVVSGEHALAGQLALVTGHFIFAVAVILIALVGFEARGADKAKTREEPCCRCACELRLAKCVRRVCKKKMTQAKAWACASRCHAPKVKALEGHKGSEHFLRAPFRLKAALRRERPACDLMQVYAAFNARYFAGKLPASVPVYWSRDIEKHGYLAALFQRPDGAAKILISKRLRGHGFLLAELLELHEMVHLELPAHTEDDDPRFQAEMQRLAAAGAFAEMW